ncbi:MAG: matrixin family metalloprotease [Polyangiaceae bacterium]|nr:matrixin family metalloprotease [Polyangiaceae bacterium]
MKRALPFAVLSFALFGAARSAHAYCYTTTCNEVYECDGDPAPDDCRVLGWASRCVGYSVQEDNRDGIKAKTLEDIVELAFDAWRTADCGDGSPGFVVQNLGRVPCDKQQYNLDAGNASIIMMRVDDWPYGSERLALTTTNFDPETGDLRDADMEINGFDYDFSVSDEEVGYDLLSVVTHEAGHFLGMNHSPVESATMIASASFGTTDLRSLDPDDIAGICQLYPPDDAPKKTCNPLPKHGFSPYCRDDQPEGSCTAGRVASEEASTPAMVALALALGALLRRRRRAVSARA